MYNTENMGKFILKSKRTTWRHCHYELITMFFVLLFLNLESIHNYEAQQIGDACNNTISDY